jgi:hypothetical protein
MDKQAIKDLREHVQRLLDESMGERGFGLKVADDSVQEAEWIYLLVTPDQEGARVYDYVRALEKAEEKLRDEGHKYVLLVPALPD